MPCFECLIFICFWFASGAIKYYIDFVYFIYVQTEEEYNWIQPVKFFSKVVFAEEFLLSNIEQYNWQVITEKSMFKFSLQAKEAELGITNSRFTFKFTIYIWISSSNIPGWDQSFSSAHPSGHCEWGAKGITCSTWNIALNLPACQP